MSVIDVQDLSKKFKDRAVLSNINFKIEQGEIFGYLGPNGAGKTTTMRILLGLLRPTVGHATVWGKDLGQDNLARRKVGVLLENDGVYDRLTAFENLRYYAQLYGVANPDAKIKGLLDFVGLAARHGDKVGKYSRGMKRKLGLARAIIHDPEVLLFDEPAAGLDPEAQKMIRDLITHLSSEKITILLSSHDLDEVQRICTRVAILQGGRIRALDTLAHLTSARPTVDVVVSDPGQVDKTLGLVSPLDYVQDVRRTSQGVSMALTDRKRSADLLAYLVTNGIRVEELKREARSLEEVYLDIVRREER